MPPRKNKRGDRGSTEDEPRNPKKSNMAAEENIDVEEPIEAGKEQEEPSLLEIKALLVDIQIQIAAVLSENRTLKKEIEELKESANFYEKELKDLKESLQKTKDEYKELKHMLASTRNELKTTKENLGKQKEESDRLWEHHDDLEQYTRKNSLEIHGIPEDAYPSTEAAVIKVAEALNITIEPEEIEISHKLNRGKSIIVKFCNHKVKSKLYKERTKLKDVKIKDLFPSYPSNAQERQRIFINENLTAYRRRIMKEATKRRQEGTLLSVWSLDGKIFVKTSPYGSPVRIFSEEDLDQL